MDRDAAGGPAPPRPLREVPAPHWLSELVRVRPAPVPWWLAFRAALAVAVPAAVGIAVGEVVIGMQTSLGALCGTFVARPGPYLFRLRRIGYSSLAGTVGLLAGGLSAGHGWWTSVVMVLLAAASALLSGISATGSSAGLMLIVFGVVGAGQGEVWDPVEATGWFAVGAGWTLTLAIAAWPVRATLPERATLAAVYTKLADLLEVSGTRAAGPARRELTGAMNEAYDVLLAARSRLEGRDAHYRKLFVVLLETTPVVEAGVALHNAHIRPSPEMIAAVREVGEAIRADSAPPDLDSRGGGPLAAALGVVAGVLRDGPRDRVERRHPSLRERLAEHLDALITGRATWLFAAQLALCVGIAEALARQLNLDRSYWVTLTVALVLKPDFGSVFARAVQRAAGTALGVLIGALVILVDPPAWALMLLVACLAGLLPIGLARNYGLFSAFVTPLVIMQLDITNAGEWDLVGTRLVDTAVGCGVVLIFGYLIWPGSRAPRLAGQLAEAVETLADYTARALAEHPAGRSALRRKTYRELSDLRLQAQRLISEPSPAGRAATAWWPAIVGLERLTDAVTRVAVDLSQSGASPVRQQDAETVTGAVRKIAAAVRAEQGPEPVSLPADPRLAAVRTDLTALYDAVRAPEFTQGFRWLGVRRKRRSG